MTHNPSINDCLALAAVEFRVGLNEILADRRDQFTSRARHVAIWLAARVCTRNRVQIGRAVGDRDVTTVLYAVRRIDAIRDRDPEFRSKLDRMVERLMPKEAA